MNKPRPMGGGKTQLAENHRGDAVDIHWNGFARASAQRRFNFSADQRVVTCNHAVACRVVNQRQQRRDARIDGMKSMAKAGERSCRARR